VPRPIAIASCSLLALALIAVPGWIAVHRGDAPAPDDRDLRLARAAAAPPDNGYDRFVAAAAATRLPRDEPTWRRFHAFRAGETWEPDWIGELVARNAPATQLVHAGLASSAFAFPAFDEGARDDRMATLLRLQQIVALAGAQARILLRDGRAADAIALDTLGLHVGKRLSGAENVDLFGIYMASTYQTVSLLDLEHAARRAPLAPADALALNQLLEATRWSAEDWRRVWAFEYERLLNDVDAASTRAGEWRLAAFPIFLLPGAYRWHPHRTAAEFASLYRDQRERSAHFCADAGVRASGRRRLAPPLHFAGLLAPNAWGRLVLAVVRESDFDRIQLKRCQFETQVSLVEVLLAARAYAGVEGELPERLEQLIPRYLGAVPLDRYDGAPLRYARAERAVYSIGEDFIDAGGGAAPNLLDPLEPGLSLAF
jgi:hypothetical protein